MSRNAVQAEETLSGNSLERTSIGDMTVKLTQLKDEVAEAQEKLQATQARVDENIERVNRLRAEAVREGACYMLEVH